MKTELTGFKRQSGVGPDVSSPPSVFGFRQKEQMQGRNGGKPVDQRYLFHGTDRTLIQAICEQNFDWRVCGVHGTAYGKGTARETRRQSRPFPQKPLKYGSDRLLIRVQSVSGGLSAVFGPNPQTCVVF